ncbi:hypothetical protein Gxy13693_061_016 [Komagataeibacter xylinus NBRC 13693]|uniref:Uncharacterized protein n=1 Tax=Komagataeibacter xylinus NBRC 13693 TaxID=1234668 RepID=A0A0D6QBA0_KOMXY|nr:hypothetical protein [Komagataeibacter xylinus]GAO00778.1 hypothetical protein Gxy13693_061_016 [Komagataeibacter xylinus NBRC 13693]
MDDTDGICPSASATMMNAGTIHAYGPTDDSHDGCRVQVIPIGTVINGSREPVDAGLKSECPAPGSQVNGLGTQVSSEKSA